MPALKPISCNRKPQTSEEWDDAVNKARLVRFVWDCYTYGIILRPEVSPERADELMEQGAGLGYSPTMTVLQMLNERYLDKLGIEIMPDTRHWPRL